MASPTSVQISLEQYVAFGTPGSDRLILNATEASTFTGNAQFTKTLELATSATDTSLDLSTELDAVSVVVIRDITSSAAGGFLFGPAALAANKFTVAAGKDIVLRLSASATPPTLYFSNPSATDKLFLEVVALGTKVT